MIVRDAEDHLVRTLESMPLGVFDQIVIVDTGSKDGTAEIAKKYATDFATYADPDPVVIDGKESISDFAAARNFCDSLVKTDYTFWIDSDDVVSDIDTFEGAVARLIRPGEYDGIGLMYDYAHDKEGNCTTRHSRERFARHGTYVWKSPIHEVQCHIFNPEVAGIEHGMLHVIHEDHRDANRGFKSQRNLEVCRRALEKDETDTRIILHYATCLSSFDRHEEAIEAYKKFLGISEWTTERYMVWLYMAERYRKLEDYRAAENACFEALKILPDFREAYIDTAITYGCMGDWYKAEHWARMALERGKDNIDYRGNPDRLFHGPYRILAQSLLEQNKPEEAKGWLVKLLKVNPSDRWGRAHMAFCTSDSFEKKLYGAYAEIERLVDMEGNQEKRNALRLATPNALKRHPVISDGLQARGKAPRLGLYCGYDGRNWGWDSMDRGGVGGSETAAIRMSEEFVKLGWEVVVYGFPEPDQCGFHNGVRWLPYYRMKPTDAFDIFICWRFQIPHIGYFPRAEKKYLWLHDIQRQSHWKEKTADLYDKIIVLSEAQRRNVDWIPDEKIWISANGLHGAFLNGKPENDPHRLIYASCPSRGLINLLDVWPEVLEKYPDARLDVFYGFTELFRQRMHTSDQFRQIYDKVMAGIKQPGIEFHGMVSQKELAKAFCRAGIWAYPTNFPEISCITAMQAQALGAIPVTTGYWALSETVKYGIKIGGPEDGIEEDESLMQDWKDALLNIMGDEAGQEQIRKEMVPWARKTFPWAEVAKEWNQEFRRALMLRESPTSKTEVLLPST